MLPNGPHDMSEFKHGFFFVDDHLQIFYQQPSLLNELLDRNAQDSLRQSILCFHKDKCSYISCDDWHLEKFHSHAIVINS